MIENILNILLSIFFIGGIGGSFIDVLFLYPKAADDMLNVRYL